MRNLIQIVGQDAALATHALQYAFLGDGGFRFSIGHFPTGEAVASDLYVLFWDAVFKLQQWGFTVCRLVKRISTSLLGNILWFFYVVS